MASFTDAISQFNPYVKELPLELMLAVGTEKQAQYDAGVQKIQGYVNNVAGLDIMKEPQRQYLKSKLNQLGGSLKLFASADFSNQQLVNTVGGMVTEITKDPIITNAVYNTSKVKKQMSSRDAAIKEGKSSIQNDLKLDDQINQWLSDGKLDSQFQGRYTKYVNYDEKLNKLYKDLGSTIAIDESVDMPYKMVNGRVIYDRNGKPVIDEVVRRTSIKGTAAEKIYQMFESSLTPEELEQFKIDSWYSYSQQPDRAMRDAADAITLQGKMLSEERVQLSSQILSGSLSPDQMTAAEARINRINTELSNENLTKKLTNLQRLLTNPETSESVKSEIFKEHYLRNKAQGLHTLNYKTTIEDNPAFKAYMDGQKLNLDWYQANTSRMSANEAIRHNKVMEEHDLIKIVSGDKASTDLSPTVVPTPIPTDLPAKELSSLNQNVQDNIDQIKMLNGKYINTVPSNLARTSDEKLAVLNKAYMDYVIDPSSVASANLREYAEQRYVHENEKRRNQNTIANVSRTITDLRKEKVDPIFQNPDGTPKAGITSGGKTVLTAKNLYDLFYNFQSTDRKTKPGTGGVVASNIGITGIEPTAGDVDYNKFLLKYKGTPFEGAANIFVKNAKGQTLTPGEKMIVTQAKKVYNENKEKVVAQNREINKGVSDLINSLDYNKQFKTVAFNPKDVRSNSAILQFLDSKAASFNNGMNAIDVPKGAKTIGITELQAYKEDASKEAVLKNLVKATDGSAVLNIGDASFVVTKEEMKTFFPDLLKSNPMDDLKYDILSTKSRTTNYGGYRDEVGGAATARFLGTALPGLKNSNYSNRVRADIEASMNVDDRYNIRLYYYDGSKWLTGTIGNQYFGPNGVLEQMQNIGPATIEDKFKINR